MAELKRVNLSELAGHIERAFSPADLGYAAGLALSVILCQGATDWHRHSDEDELLLVHEGVVFVESEWGSLMLYPEEAIVVPKGIGHRLSSALRSVALLVRPGALANRTNGHFRLFATPGEAHLKKSGLGELATQLESSIPYSSVPVTAFADSTLDLVRCVDTGPWQAAEHGTAILVERGTVEVEVTRAAQRASALRTSRHSLTCNVGDLVLVPAGFVYQLAATEPALVLMLHKLPG